MWRGDGSSNINVVGDTVTIAKPDDAGDAPINAMYVAGSAFNGGTSYWEVEFTSLDGSAFVGLCPEEKFAAGYKLSGYLYGGNLADGGGLLKGNWGKHIAQGDRVGIAAKVDGGKLKLFLFMNGNPLGCAYDLEKYGSNLRPVISISNKAVVKLHADKTVPAVLEVPEIFQLESLVGKWEDIALTIPNVQIAPPGQRPPMTVEFMNNENAATAQAQRFSMGVHVMNRMSYSMERASNGTCKITGGASTMMMPIGPAAIMEQQVRELLVKADKAELQNGGQELCISGPGNWRFVFRRCSSRHGPVTEVQLR